MKKTILFLSLVTPFNLLYSNYIIKIPLETTQGGSLPSNSIQFNTIDETSLNCLYELGVNSFRLANVSGNLIVYSNSNQIIPTNDGYILGDKMYIPGTMQSSTAVANTYELCESEIKIYEPRYTAIRPTYTSWENDGEIFDCDTWTPDNITINDGEQFTQTANCQQNQTRLKQNREINLINGLVSNTGETETENRLIATIGTRDSIGTGTSWETFAIARDLPTYWQGLNWMNQGLSEIPLTQYPLTTVDMIVLQGNQLTNVNGLSNITNITHGLNLGYNNLSDISGLQNIQFDGVYIYIDPSYSGPKLPANSRFCTLNSFTKFNPDYAQKSQLCE